LKINEEIPPGSFSIAGTRIAILQFFKPLKPNLIFTFEKSVEIIAECELNAEKIYLVGERSFKIYMKLNGAFIEIQGAYKKWKKMQDKT